MHTISPARPSSSILTSFWHSLWLALSAMAA